MVRKKTLYQATIVNGIRDNLALLAKGLQNLCGLSFRVSDVYVHWIEMGDKSVYWLWGAQQQELFSVCKLRNHETREQHDEMPE